jgi:uridine kinase
MEDLYTVHDYKTIEEKKIHTVSFINSVIESGHASDMILVTEAVQEKRLGRIAEEIAARENVRMVLLAGPSSSGKTSTSKRLCIQLMTCRKHPVALSTDNWFVERKDTPRDKDGNLDFETIHAMDLKLFNSDLQRLIDGEEVALPTFNFTTGTREYHGDTLRLTSDMILVIEGIHALNPMLTELIPADRKYKIFAAPMSPISLDGRHWIPTTANRLLRRISRDYQTRGKTAQQTIESWGSVRRGEKKWILPFMKEADAVFDTSMLYELAALEKVLEKVPSDAREYRIAEKLLQFLHCIKPIWGSQIPHTSLMREFIGGSIFNVG